jgi:hypothetical protein
LDLKYDSFLNKYPGFFVEILINKKIIINKRKNSIKDKRRETAKEG